MDDKTIAALLALPTEAKEALKGCEGAGYAIVHVVAVKDEGGALTRTQVQLWPSAGDCHFAMAAWMPCNPLEIVRVALVAAPDALSSGVEYDHKTRTCWARLMCRTGDLAHEAEGETPHLAALALLKEVWR